MFGPGSSFFGASTNSGGGGISGANNGLTVSTIDPSKIVFGQNLGQAGNPGALLSTRQVPMASFAINWDDGQMVYTHMLSPSNELVLAGVPLDWFRVIFPAANPNAAHQEIFTETDNGDGTFDLQHFWGFNVDKMLNPALPSWTRRMEYFYNHTNYEDHLQYQSVAGGVYRMCSTTVIDVAGVISSLEFHKGSTYEWRLLTDDVAQMFFTPGNTDFVFGLSNDAQTLGVQISSVTASNEMDITPIGGGHPNMIFQTWDIYQFKSDWDTTIDFGGLTLSNDRSLSYAMLSAQNNVGERFLMRIFGSTHPSAHISELIASNNTTSILFYNSHQGGISDGGAGGTSIWQHSIYTQMLKALNFVNFTPGVIADGDIYFDGTNFKTQVGGVSKTFTLI
jgi:hypothetical protein